ncbi:pilus assembly protein [Vreelandella utahensis]|uniref:pilus assembly protein n=1 Tax=Vreelandella halophila TaxID=86177 RepID=UPI00098655A0|nr:pilus assembly protein [Halomonas utahensis]
MRQSILTRKRNLGQGMTEYIIITALIAIAAIGVYSMFGETVRNQVAGMAQEMRGEDAQDEIDAAGDAADDATDTADTTVDLGDYNDTGSSAAD